MPRSWARVAAPRPSTPANCTSGTASVLATTWTVLELSARPCVAEAADPDRVELLGVGVLRRQARCVEPEEPQAGEREQAGGDHPDLARLGGHPVAHAGPETVARGLVGAGRSAASARTPSDRRPGAGRRVTITRKVTLMPTASTGPMPAVEFSSAKARRHADHHGGGARQDRRRRAVQREGHRLVPVLVAAQAPRGSGHEEQGVVGARADDQDAEDRLALPVDGEVGVLRQQVDHARRGHVGEDGADDRQQPQGRAAVGGRITMTTNGVIMIRLVSMPSKASAESAAWPP